MSSRSTRTFIQSSSRPIMIVTIDPATGKVWMVSLPRDTENVPLGEGVVDFKAIVAKAREGGGGAGIERQDAVRIDGHGAQFLAEGVDRAGIDRERYGLRPGPGNHTLPCELPHERSVFRYIAP